MQLGEITEPKIDQAGPPPTGEFTYVDISSVDNGAKRIVDPKVLPADSAPSRARQRLRSGDVLVSMTRPNLNAVALLPPELDGAIGSTGFHILRARESVLPQWLYYGVQTRRFVGAMTELVQGALYPAVRPKDIRAFDLPVPELDEQRRIVAELEKQFSRLDEAIANLKRVKANLKRQVAAVLKTAFEGGLVRTEFDLASEDGREVESGRDLLRRLLDARRVALAGKRGYREPAAPIINLSRSLPNGWTWATADQLTLQITDGEHITPPRTAAGVLLLSARNVLNGRLALDDVDHISEEEHERLCGRLNVQSGDVLLSCSGSVGRSCVVPEGLRISLVRSVAVLKPNGVMPEFLSYQLRSPRCQEQIEDSKTETAQANLFQGKIRQLVFGLPPLAEQRRIVAEVDRRVSIVREVEAEVDANLKRAQALRQAVLAQAFSC